jgi:hypothetical protein
MYHLTCVYVHQCNYLVSTVHKNDKSSWEERPDEERRLLWMSEPGRRLDYMRCPE